MSVLNDSFATELVKIAAKASQEDSYAKQMAVLAPLTAAQSASDLPKGWAEKSVESVVQGKPAKDALKKGLTRGLARAPARFVSAVPTTPLFLSGVRDIKESKTDEQKRKGVAKVVASGAIYSGIKGGLEAGLEAGADKMTKAQVLDKIKALSGARAITGTLAAAGTAAAVGKARSKKGKPTVMSEYVVPGLAGAGIGGAKGMYEVAHEAIRKGKPRVLLTPGGIRNVAARGLGRGVGGAAGAVVISKMLSAYENKGKPKQLRASKKNPRVRRWQKTASAFALPTPSSYIQMDLAPSAQETHQQVRTWAQSAPTEDVQRHFNQAALRGERSPTSRSVHYALHDELASRRVTVPPPTRRGDVFPPSPSTNTMDVLKVGAAVAAPSAALAAMMSMPAGAKERLLAESVDRLAAVEGIKRMAAGKDFWGLPEYAATAGGKRIWAPPASKAHPFAVAHEMGHAAYASIFGKHLQLVDDAYKAGAIGAVLFPVVALVGMSDNSFTTPTELEDRAAFARVMGTLSGVAMAPQLVDEAVASLRGLAFLSKAGAGRGEILKAVGKMGVAFGTYAAPLAAPLVAGAILDRRARKRRQEIETHQLREARGWS